MTPGATPVRYRSADEDSARWNGFLWRDGDIVISTRSKSGTTWMQMICALLIFRTAELPRSLAEMSPWLDHRIEPIEDVVASLEAQHHRRFIKTHTPLDGLPLDDRVSYIVVGRHPLDAAVSLYHQGANLNRERMAELIGEPEIATAGPRPTLAAWLRKWIDWDGSPREQLDSLPGFMWHLTDAWQRRHDANITLVHYADLSHDLEGEMQRLADRLGVQISPDEIRALAPAATFASMRERSDLVAPDTLGVLTSTKAFFRAGQFGDGRNALDAADLHRYETRASELASEDLLTWLHR